MSSKNVFDNEVSVDEQAFEQADEREVDGDRFEVVDETAEFRVMVDMEVQAKVDSNHPDARVEEGTGYMFRKALEQEECKVWEAELERISAQAELGTQEGGRRGREISRQNGVRSDVESEHGPDGGPTFLSMSLSMRKNTS